MTADTELQDEPLAEETVKVFRTWGAEPLASIPVMDRTLVHKRNTENVFVSRIERVNVGSQDIYVIQFYIDPAHAFFFEHPLDHVPALMLMEAGRQAGTALLHLYHGVPEDSVFILRDMSADFSGFAELDQPVFGTSAICEPKLKNGRLTGMLLNGWFVQNERKIGKMSGRWFVYDRRVAERMREMSRSSAAVRS